MSEKHEHNHSVRAAYSPQANRALLLRPKCEVCRRPFFGGVFQLRCDRPSCANQEKKVKMRNAQRGTLTVVQLARVTGNGTFWRCKCDCGRAVIKSEAYLDSRRPTCGQDCSA